MESDEQNPHHLPAVEEEKDKEEEAAAAGHYDFDSSSPESSPDHKPDSIEQTEQHNISHPPSTSPPPPPEETDEGHYELESSPEPEFIQLHRQQHPPQEEEVASAAAHNNNHNIAHPPPPSVTVQYSSPPRLLPPQQDSPYRIRKALDESSSPESPALNTPAAASTTAAGPKVGRGRPNLSILRKVKSEKMRRRSLIGCRSCGLVLCLVSLSVLAADKDQGWALDSFYRYREFRYCLTVNVIGFMYSSLQAADFAYTMMKGQANHPARNLLRDCFDFSLDQVMAYLLLSASTTAAYRVEEWESNWGKDQFPTMARASLSISFLAFIAFAFTSLLSGYTLFTSNSF
ncbi:CASP-like protein 4A3 [Linum grandiflorum]